MKPSVTRAKHLFIFERMARLSTYNEKTAQAIINALLEGQTLRHICNQLNLKVCTVYNWLKNNPSFKQDYEAARDFADELMEEEALRLADTPNIAKRQVMYENGTTVITEFDDVARSRLQIEARLKIVARRKGGKVTAEIRQTEKKEVPEGMTEMYKWLGNMNRPSGAFSSRQS